MILMDLNTTCFTKQKYFSNIKLNLKERHLKITFIHDDN